LPERDLPQCPSPCGSGTLGLSAFRKNGKRDPRYQCKECRGTFSIGSPTRRHKQTDKNGFILRSLINKAPLSRLCETAQVGFPQIYEKIDFLYQQCLAFSAEREKRLPACFEGKRPFFATDVQTILVNWPVKNRRGTIPLLHMATVHRRTQFVIASTVDYDPDVDPEKLEAAMVAAGDFTKVRARRKHARL